MEIITISKEKTFTYIEKKSKFIAFAFPCDNKETADKIIDKLHNDYPDATHICYGYIIFDNQLIYKAFDDGEPSQTAGAPILNVIKKNNLVNTLVAVIRYFGGIKLGAGGLTRAYSNVASETIKQAEIVKLVNNYKIDLSFDYDLVKDVDKFLQNFNIIEKKYDIKITYTILTNTKEEIDNIIKKIEYLGVVFTNLGIVKSRVSI